MVERKSFLVSSYKGTNPIRWCPCSSDLLDINYLYANSISEYIHTGGWSFGTRIGWVAAHKLSVHSSGPQMLPVGFMCNRVFQWGVSYFTVCFS